MNQKKRIYLSGPISGRNPEECRQAFAKAESKLQDMGFEVFNPLKNGLPFDAETHRHMHRDLNVLTSEDKPFDYIYMMQRWLHSAGCKLEFDVATACGISVLIEGEGGLINKVKFT